MATETPTSLGVGPAGIIVGPGANLQINFSLAKPIEIDSGGIALSVFFGNAVILCGPIATHGGASIVGNGTIALPVTIDGGLTVGYPGEVGDVLTLSEGIQETSPGSSVQMNVDSVVLDGSTGYTGGNLRGRRILAGGRHPANILCPRATYRQAHVSGDTPTSDALLALLAGQPNVAAAAKRSAGVKGEIDHFGALNFLQGLLTVLRDSGGAGLLAPNGFSGSSG